MAGYFELVDAPEGGYRLRMMDGAGQLMAVSVTFPTKKAAVAGVARAREIAGTGLVRDRTAGGRPASLGPAPRVARRPFGGAGHSVPVTGVPAAAGKRARARH
jgi:uncharacterized protein YegP (UPF0339 family)